MTLLVPQIGRIGQNLRNFILLSCVVGGFFNHICLNQIHPDCDTAYRSVSGLHMTVRWMNGDCDTVNSDCDAVTSDCETFDYLTTIQPHSYLSR